MVADGWGQRVRPGTFGKITSRLNGSTPKVPVQNKEHEFAKIDISKDIYIYIYIYMYIEREREREIHFICMYQ